MMILPRAVVLGFWASFATLHAQTPTLFRLPLQSNPGISYWVDHDPRSGYFLRYDGDTRDSGIGTGYDGHTGTDFAAQRDTPILAGADGVVYQNPVTNCPDVKGSDDPFGKACGSRYGNHVRLRHADGKVSIYAHMLTPEVNLNSSPQCGTEIGRSGRSGDTSGSTGYHLHFELWRDINASQRLDFFSGSSNPIGYWVSQNGAPPGVSLGTQCQTSGVTLPVITSFDITPHSTTVGTQLVATVKGNAGSNPLSTAALKRTADLTGTSGWTTTATQTVSGSSVNVSLYDTPPAGTFLYGAHLVDNTGQYGAEPSKVQVTVTAQSSPEITSLTAIPQQAAWVYYQSNSLEQWYISSSSGETYLLSGASGYSGELVWGKIANGPVATVNYQARTVYVGPSASAQTSATSYSGVTIAGGRSVNVLSSRGYAAAQQVAGQTMSHAWYFFRVQSTGTWYIVNLNGATTEVYRLRLKSDNSDYDWLLVSNSSWRRSLSGTASSMTITLSER